MDQTWSLEFALWTAALGHFKKKARASPVIFLLFASPLMIDEMSYPLYDPYSHIRTSHITQNIRIKRCK
jgi:hypothetical protein